MRHSRFASTLRSSFLVCGLAIGLIASTSAATAQSSGTSVKVDIPFAFQVGSQHMPAGRYHVDLKSRDVILLRGPGNNASGFVMVHSAERIQAPNTGSMVFDAYGNKYFLHQIWTVGDKQGRECTKSRAEKEILQAQTNQAPTLVELALVDNTQR